MLFAFVTEEEKAARRQVCDQCVYLRKATNQCRLCGCLVAAKVMFKTAKCPAGRW